MALEGLTITSDSGYVATISGIPALVGSDLQVQWFYRDALMLTALPGGLTENQVVAELQQRMDAIDSQRELDELVGQVIE